MLFGTILILFIIEFLSWIKYKDLLCPAVLHNVLWIISILFLVNFEASSGIKTIAFVTIICGSILFQVAFSLGTKLKVGNKKQPFTYKITVNQQTTKVLIIVLLIVALPEIYQYVVYLRGSGISIYYMLRYAEDEINLPRLFDYYRKTVEFFFLAFLTLYLKMDTKKKLQVKKYIIILFIIAALAVASLPTRNSILFFMLPLVIIFLINGNASNRKIAFVGIIVIIVFMVFFYLVSLSKYWYIYDDAASKITVIKDEIATYLSGSIIAFGTTITQHAFSYNGQNTCRFFIAVFDRLFGTSNALDLVQEFVTIGNNITTNVYTFYDFYLRDFGVLYALLAQGIVGVIHGCFYKGMNKGKPVMIFGFSMLTYPLIMQFFQDQYVSLLSTWLQVIIVAFVVFKTNLFFKCEPIYINEEFSASEDL